MQRVAAGALFAAGSVVGCGEGAGAGPLDRCVAAGGQAGAGAALAIDVGAAEGPCGEEGEGCAAAGFVGDGPYEAARGHGWLGPAETGSRPWFFARVFPIATHTGAHPTLGEDAYFEAIAPYTTWVVGLTGYRVDLPDGLYRVTLLLIEPDFPEPGLRAFDVGAGGATLVEALDLAALAGQDEAVALSVQAPAVGGALEIAFAPTTDAPPLLAGLIVEPAAARAPDAPAGLEARAGAGEALLRWSPPPEALRGWLVERSVDGGPFAPAEDALVPAPALVDRGRAPGERLVYRVTPVDASCTPGEPATSPEVVPLMPEAFGLPIIDVTVAPAAFAAIHVDPAADLDAPAEVTDGLNATSGTIDLRGGSTRWAAKRSFTLRLDAPIDGRTRLKLLAEVPDPTRLWQLAAYDLAGRLGTLAPRARPVLLRINGAVYGVYDDIEHVGDAFLESHGYGVDDRFRAYDTFVLRREDSGAIDLSRYEKNENRADPSPELEALVVWLNSAPEHEVVARLGDFVDTDVLVRYLALNIAVANHDYIDGGHYLALDPANGRFLIVPWDFNNETFTRAGLPLAYATPYTAGAKPDCYSVNWLWTRALGSPAFRAELAVAIEDAVAAGLRVDDLRAAIGGALAVEPWIWRRRFEPVVDGGPAAVAGFAAERAAFVGAALPALASLGGGGPVIARIEPDAVEIENRGETAIEPGACFLSQDPLAPRAEPLDAEGEIAPGARARAPFAASPAGGYVSLGCDVAGEEAKEKSGFASTSFVFYPALAPGQAYVRTDAAWAVK